MSACVFVCGWVCVCVCVCVGVCVSLFGWVCRSVCVCVDRILQGGGGRISWKDLTFQVGTGKSHKHNC